MPASKTTTRDFSLVVGQSAVQALPPGGPSGMDMSYMRVWNVSASATVWCSRAGQAAIGAAGSFPLGPGLYEMFTFPQTVPVNGLSLIATAAGTPVTIEVG
jgi:hypothetical protein